MNQIFSLTPRAILIVLVASATVGYLLVYKATPWCTTTGISLDTCEFYVKILVLASPCLAIALVFLFILRKERIRWEQHRAEMDAVFKSVEHNIAHAEVLMKKIKAEKSESQKAKLIADARRWIAEQEAVQQKKSPPPGDYH